MLRWSMIFLVIAIVAAILGFGGLAYRSRISKNCIFYIFSVICYFTNYRKKSIRKIVGDS